MKNAEKFRKIFREFATEVWAFPEKDFLTWLNAEYKEPTTKNNLEVREFEEIEVTYPPEEVCTYPEYKEKPYFAIKYKENGESIVGYGTYNPQVLSRYLKDYFMPTTKNNLGVDCISRADAIKAMQNKAKKLTNEDTINGLCGAVAILFELPSVTPQEPKMGRWIANAPQYDMLNPQYICSECGNAHTRTTPYCEMCGAKMVEPQESEE